MVDVLKGVVIKSTGSWYQVRLEPDHEILPCRIVGKFRLDGLKLTNPVAVGDEVFLSRENDGTGIIREIGPRSNYIVRQSPRQLHQLHLLASNVDQAVLIVTMVHPMFKPGFVDRFLMMTEPQRIPTLIVFNKADLYEEEDLELCEQVRALYQHIGYESILTSATDKRGLDQLQSFLKGKVSLISGQSGVGKSTLINSVQPQLELRTGDISDYSGKGQHTTTFAEMHPLDFGGSIIDTPGIKTLAFNNLTVQDVAHNFREFFELASECKYGDCTHRNEPHCAIKAALEKGKIAPIRYTHYLQILDEIENQNYWEIHTDM